MPNVVLFQTTILHISGTNKDNLMPFSILDAYFKYFYLKYELNTSITEL